MSEQLTDYRQLQKYRSHKEVHAAQIAIVTGETMTLSDGRTVEAAPGMFTRYTPVGGDYYVVYEDGYASISPRAAFEGGYTAV